MYHSESPQTPEAIHTKEEIIALIRDRLERPVAVKERHDEKGLYVLTLRAEGADSKNFSEYEFLRQGNFPDRNSSAETSITRIDYVNGEVDYAEQIARWNPVTGQWESL